ncbi:Leucine-rich repeat-containing protein 20, partial [Stegodyphus mimosarum]
MMCEVIPSQMIQVAMAGKAVTKVVHRCYTAKEDRNLNLSECQLMSFPEAVYHLMRNTVLQTCDLSSNVFRKIPPQLPIKFERITELNLSHNRLTSLPEELKDLKELQKLDLSHNDFLVFPKVVFKIPHLVFLNLKKNFIVDVDVSKVRTAPALKELNLEENPLTRTAYVQLKALMPGRILIHVTEPKPEDDDDSDFEVSPPNSSV